MSRVFSYIKSILVVTTGVVLAFALAAHADDFPSRFHLENPPRALPPVVFQDADGAQHTLADFRGHFVLLNIWATWCGPCVKEMPSLDALQNRIGKDRLTVLPLSEDRSDGIVSNFYHRHALANLQVAVDMGGVVPFALHVTGLPTTLLINPQGLEIARLEGDADWNSQSAVAILFSQINASNRL